MSPSQAPNRRADARRSRAAILDAALRLLNADPDTRVESIATAAGITRQTVYAHFPTREHLLAAVADQITDETAAAMDAADPDSGPAAEAILRVLDAAQRSAGRHLALLPQISALRATSESDRERHTPIGDRLERVIVRGRRNGEFDDRLPPDWLVTVTIKLAHTASEEAAAGRMSAEDAARAMRVSLLRVLGVTDDS